MGLAVFIYSYCRLRVAGFLHTIEMIAIELPKPARGCRVEWSAGSESQRRFASGKLDFGSQLFSISETYQKIASFGIRPCYCDAVFVTGESRPTAFADHLGGRLDPSSRIETDENNLIVRFMESEIDTIIAVPFRGEVAGIRCLAFRGGRKSTTVGSSKPG